MATSRVYRTVIAPPALLLVALIGMSDVSTPAEAQDSNLTACPTTVSREGRLMMEQWSASGDCSKPSRTRVVDRFLGFTCTEPVTGPARCRAYWPGEGSRAFDTTRHYRCIDVAVTASEEGTRANRMREWIATQPKQCNWSPDLPVLAMEVDFDNGEVCLASFCVGARQLSPLGRLRLRHLVERALREMGLMGGEGAQTAAVMLPEILRLPMLQDDDGLTRNVRRLEIFPPTARNR